MLQIIVESIWGLEVMIMYTCVIKVTSRVPVRGARRTPADTAWDVGRGSLAPSRDSVAHRQMGKTFINPGKTGTDGNAEMEWDGVGQVRHTGLWGLSQARSNELHIGRVRLGISPALEAGVGTQ